jgi:3-phytase
MSNSSVFALATVSLWLLVNNITVTQMTPLAKPANSKDIEFLGEAIFPTGTQFKGTEVGGLSGITYNQSKNVYYSISDDRSNKAPARFYTLKIDLSGGTLKKVDVVNVTTLVKADGKHFPALSLDPEGIAFKKNGSLFISSEGDTNRLIKPFVNLFSLTGKQIQVLPIPQKFLPTAKKDRGIRDNLAFESLTITPNQKYLFTATENALYQDGAAATINSGSSARILKYNLPTRKTNQEFLYITEPIAGSPNTAILSNNGLVDLAAIDNNHLLSLERSFSPIKGNTIRLYEVSLAHADDISKRDLKGININKIKSAQKKLLLDFNELKIPLDNIEGLTFGQCLPDKRRSLIVVSDNNFSSLQFTQILAFAVNNKVSRCVRG